MSNIHEFPHQKDIYEEPSEWLAKLDRGLTHEEEASLKEWLASDPNHSVLLLRVAELWDRMDALSRLNELFPTPESQSPRFGWAPAVIAASLFVIVGATIWAFNSVGLLDERRVADIDAHQYIETAVGQQSTIGLPDGSQLLLNTDSKVAISYDGYERKLILDRGEIHITVAHDEMRPLRVYTRGKVFQAVGTAFNLELKKDDRIELIVTDGAVLVAENDRFRANAASNSDGGDKTKPLIVSEGEKARINSPERAVADIVAEDIDAQLSWREGAIVFQGETLAEALAEVERYVSVDFVLQDEELTTMRVAGRFRTGDVAELLTALKDNFGIIHYRVDQDTIVLTKRI